MTYEENLRKTAEGLFSIVYPVVPDDMELQYRLMKHLEKAAEYCLKKQAESYRKGWSASCGVSEIESELKKLGLIP